MTTLRAHPRAHCALGVRPSHSPQIPSSPPAERRPRNAVCAPPHAGRAAISRELSRMRADGLLADNRNDVELLSL